MTLTTIPQKLAKHHGGEDAAMLGLKWAETFEVHGGLSGQSKVLDIGCGPGRMAAAIATRFEHSTPSYLGFDIQAPDIKWCTRNITNVHPAFRFEHVNVLNGHYNPKGTIKPEEVRFPAADNEFDFAFATSVFTHMYTAEFLVYLREARRCLKPGGRFLATFFCLEADFAGKMPEKRDFSTALDDHCYTARPQNPEDAIAFDTAFVMDSFKQAGFEAQFYRGGWSRLRPATGRHSQDYIVATKLEA